MRRFLELISVAAVIAAVVGLLKLAPVPVFSQAQQPPKTAWGEPDLQGIWMNEYQIPLQRDPKLAGREFFTDEEIAERNKRQVTQPTFSVRSARRGTEQDVAGAYDLGFQAERRANAGRQTSMIVDPPDGRIPPFTPEVRKRQRETDEYRLALLQATESCKDNDDGGCAGVKFTGQPSARRNEQPPHFLIPSRPINRVDNPEDFGLSERCLAGALPNVGGIQRIVQSACVVAMVYEGWQRVIPITSLPHPPAHIRQWRGDSRGRWEGNTLVVDVTNFTAKTEYQGSRENLHLIERLSRANADTLEYAVTMEDPTTWARPWTIKVELTKQRDEENAIYDGIRCHDTNYSMAAMLRGARVDDKAFADGRGPNPATKCYIICGFGLEDLADIR